jgi:hypothetical protein
VITQRVYAHLLGDRPLDALADAHTDPTLRGALRDGPRNDESR